VPSERNARTHSPEQIAQLVASIGAFGWTNPILIDEDRAIIAGHGRLEAARAAGLADVPTITLTGLSAAQKRALAIADNKLALNAGWDDELLRLELGELGLEGFDLSLIGFSDLELKDILTDPAEGLTDPDDVPEPPAEPVTRPGDVWLLGRHRLVCGNSTRDADVILAMDGALADVVFTDPPYGVHFGGSANAKISGDISQVAIPISFKHAIDHATKPDARVYFCGGSTNVQMYYSLFDTYLRQTPNMIIWNKGQIVLRRNNYHSQYEAIFFGWRGVGGGPGNWFGERTADVASDIWTIKRDNGADYKHPTQKPTALAERAISNSCPAGGVVYEPFSGSGSTIIAAEMTGRACHAIEISPQYVDVAARRWQSFTGQTATLERDGRAFADIETERRLADAA
jgi:hypothetical protein